MFDIINFIFWILIIFDTHGRFDKHLDHPLVQIYCKNQAVSMGYLYPWQKSEGNYIGVIRLAFCELRKNPHVEYHEPNRFIIEDSENNQFFKLMQFNASFRCEMMKLAEKNRVANYESYLNFLAGLESLNRIYDLLDDLNRPRYALWQKRIKCYELKGFLTKEDYDYGTYPPCVPVWLFWIRD